MSDYEDYENLAFPPQMPRCDIEELKAKLENSEKMRDLQAEYACKLEEKLKIAEEALEYYADSEHISGCVSRSSTENCYYCDGDIEDGYEARKALEKIRG